jgi:hypothetical protein
MNQLLNSLRFIGNLIWRFAYYFYLIPFEEAFHNLKEFPLQIRILSIIGYTSVAILLSSLQSIPFPNYSCFLGGLP